jgi:hypothetical protein
VGTLLALGYPALAGEDGDAFAARFEPLREVAARMEDLPPAGTGRVPLVLVVTRDVVDPELTVPLLRLAAGGERPGVLDPNHGEGGLAPYRPVPAVALPDPAAYLLLDVDRGDGFRGVAPAEALESALDRGRSPLTVEEGIAVATHAPHLLERNHCFSLAGSRRGDRRVPALWISAGAPKLGWCWAGNPHDWLGLATAAAREA